MAQTTEAEIIRVLREIHRLQVQATKYRRQMKENKKNMRQARRELKALQGALEDRRPDVFPSRLHGGVTGLLPMKVNEK